MPVHLYGHPSSMKAIMDIAKCHHLKVVEDAAPALGATFAGKMVGTFGDAGCFSFQGAKMVSTGEGGVIFTNDSDLFSKIKHFAEHGRASDGFDISDIGFKYKMSNLQAAWGCAQLERIDELIDKKREIYRWYKDELFGIDGLFLNKRSFTDYFEYEDEFYQDGEMPIYWMTSIVLDKEFHVSRDGLMIKLKERGVDTRPFFPQMSSFRMFKCVNNPMAAHIGSNGINLPSGHDLTQYEVKYICHCIKDILGV